MGQVKRKRRIRNPQSLGKGARRHARLSSLNEQAEDRETVLLSERAQSGDGFGIVHESSRSFDEYRNIFPRAACQRYFQNYRK